MATNHSRKISSRAALPRRNTKGPLQPEDPLFDPPTSYTPPPVPSFQPAKFSTIDAPLEELSGRVEVSQETEDSSDPSSNLGEKDLSFLLDASIYQNLDPAEIPSAFRKPLPPSVSPDTSMSKVLKEVDRLLSGCDFFGAAYLAANTLTSGLVRPTDTRSIFLLLAIRFSCLELCGQTLVAAQETKALEDLTSAFYYLESPEMDAEDLTDRSPPVHIIPFPLRLQILRLQSIGFSDPRRGVTSLYDIGMECRQHIVASTTSSDQRQIWRQRLTELGIRVVNALIEMGELDCAERTLDTMQPSTHTDRDLWLVRKVLLLIRMGRIAKARSLLQGYPTDGKQSSLLLETISLIADGEYARAAELMSGDAADQLNDDSTALLKQNLAVAELYKGNLSAARNILEGLVDEKTSFQTLTINLATVYDLSSDHSRDLKLSLTGRIAQHQETTRIRSFTNADFKL